jgi:hypothetical protein
VKTRTTWSFGHIAILVGAATILTVPALLNLLINIVLHEYSAGGSLPGATLFERVAVSATVGMVKLPRTQGF